MLVSNGHYPNGEKSLPPHDGGQAEETTGRKIKEDGWMPQLTPSE
jgi:hypothetical protein